MSLVENNIEQRGVLGEEHNPYPTPDVMAARLSVHPAKEEILVYCAKYDIKIDEILCFPRESQSKLQDKGILRHFIAGNIEIYPFHHELLKGKGYDVRLGKYYYIHDGDWRSKFIGIPIYNPHDPESVHIAWGEPKKMASLSDLASRVEGEFGIEKFAPKNIKPDDLILLLRPSLTALLHTEEFIGGRNVITTQIFGKSSIGRNMLEVCSDASLGDVGFINRWTLEITNKSTVSMNTLVAGEAVATIVFEQVEAPGQQYQGRYQEGYSLADVVKSWTPESMLPKWPRPNGYLLDIMKDNDN